MKWKNERKRRRGISETGETNEREESRHEKAETKRERTVQEAKARERDTSMTDIQDEGKEERKSLGRGAGMCVHMRPRVCVFVSLCAL